MLDTKRPPAVDELLDPEYLTNLVQDYYKHTPSSSRGDPFWRERRCLRLAGPLSTRIVLWREACPSTS